MIFFYPGVKVKKKEIKKIKIYPMSANTVQILYRLTDRPRYNNQYVGCLCLVCELSFIYLLAALLYLLVVFFNAYVDMEEAKPSRILETNSASVYFTLL